MDLEQWLTAQGLEEHLEVFVENRIEVDVLEHLTEVDLREMGLPIGSVRRFLAAVQPQGQDGVDQAPASVAPSITAAPQPPQPPQPVTAAPQTAQPNLDAPAASAVHAPDVSPPASSPQVQESQTQATRHEPKAKNSRKATAIMVAVGVHVALIIIATTLTIFAASKVEPEIIAAIAPPSTTPQQEMKKKTVQKQVKRAPSAASAAAAPMAIMMKANAAARFTTPEVTRTSTGPLGVGEGDLGTGAFGVGSGLGDAGSGSFFGTTTSGNLAVIFDVTGSMNEASDRVVSEINRTFKTAHVVCVFGAKFLDEPKKMLPYESNKNIQQSLRNQSNQSMNQNMLSLKNCDSLEMGNAWPRENVANLPMEARKKQMQSLGSLGTAMEMLLNQKRPPGTIFVFSDYKDGADPKYMEKVAALAKRKKVKVVIWFPFSKSEPFRDREHYETFVKMVGGELKIEKL